ncbi:hypothetical protein CU097_001116, partial [Rhizopus azygosporus]
MVLLLSMKGKRAAPTRRITKEIKRKCKQSNGETEFVLVDEYLTSQICNKCKSKKLNSISIIGSKRRVHSVLKCESCGTVWNHDVNSITDFYLETKPYEQTRLVIKAFDNVFYLHLEPNTELFHPQAVIYQDGQSVPVDRDIIYKGHVIHAGDSDYIWPNYKEQQDSLGWARLMIYKRPDDSYFIQGSFRVHDT